MQWLVRLICGEAILLVHYTPLLSAPFTLLICHLWEKENLRVRAELSWLIIVPLQPRGIGGFPPSFPPQAVQLQWFGGGG